MYVDKCIPTTIYDYKCRSLIYYNVCVNESVALICSNTIYRYQKYDRTFEHIKYIYKSTM